MGPYRSILRLLLAASGVLALSAPDLYAATITVTSTADTVALDSGVTLREAIESINAGSNQSDVVAVGAYGTNDRIEFNIAGAGPHTITAGTLTITRTVVIDGLSQPGAAFGTPLIEVSGLAAQHGLVLANVSNAVIRGLIVHTLGYNPIEITAGSNNRIQANFVGTNVTGTAAAPGNGRHGVNIEGGTGHVIGTDGDGVDDALEGNVISGLNAGIAVYLNTTSGARVAGNLIGTNAAGTAAIPSARGLILDTSSDCIIGTNGDGMSDDLERNVIAGNSSSDLRISRSFGSGIEASRNRVSGNYIGTNATGTAVLSPAIAIQFDSAVPQANIIGGAVPGLGNLIGFGTKGVVVGTTTIVGDPLGNSILGNTFLGPATATTLAIDLRNDLVTLNDDGDADVGPNNFFNFPFLTGATLSGGTLTLAGFARPGSTIEFFVVAPDAAGERRTFLGTLIEGSPADTDVGAGSYNDPGFGTDTTNRFQFAVPIASLPAGSVLTATATAPAPDGSTSEFGNRTPVVFAPDLSITATAAPGVVQPGGTITYTMIVTNPDVMAAPAVQVSLPPAAGLQLATVTGAGCTTLPCAIASLPAGPATITATFTVPSTYRSPVSIATTAIVGSTAPDPNPANNSVPVAVSLASADLVVVKTGPQLAARDVDPLAFEIVVSNRGPQEAIDVVVSDPTPAGITFDRNEGACTTAFPCSLGTLPPGQVRTITARYLVPIELTDPIANTATVSSTTPDPDPLNNTATATTSRQANLSITKTGPATIQIDESVQYTITVTNAGPNSVAEATITDPTPAGLTPVGTTGACASGFPCTLASIRPGQTLTILATYRVNQGGSSGTTIVNTATVSAPLQDPDPSNNTATATAVLTTATDTDGDTVSDTCQMNAGLPSPTDPNADADGDGVTNLEECEQDTHPRGVQQRYLPEGSTGSFYAARLTIANHDAALPAHVLIHFDPEGAAEVTNWILLQPGGRTVLDATAFVGVASFATQVESDVPVSVERTMTWVTGGSHADTALDALSTEWYFAEGATTGGFQLYYLLQNPGDAPADVAVTFLGAATGAVTRDYTLAPRSRTSLWINQIPELVDANVAVRIQAAGVPIAAARAMYRDWQGQTHVAGGAASGADRPRLDWYFAEGVTGTFFDTWLLLANFDAADATVDVAYLRPAGPELTVPVTVPAGSRVSIRVADADPALAGGDVAMHVHASGGVPVVAERAVWWQSPNYYEGHHATGAAQTAPVWHFGDAHGDIGNERYVLVANFGATAGEVLLTVAYDEGDVSTRVVPVAARSRVTLSLDTLVPESVGRPARLKVESVGAPLPLVVERSVYTDVNGRRWGSGTAVVGTPVIASGASRER